VIDRRYLRQSRKPRESRPVLLFFPLRTRLNISTLRSRLHRNWGAQIPTLSGRSDASFHLPYLLPSSVSRNSFVWRSYENCRGVYQQFPFWNDFTAGVQTFRPVGVSTCFRPISFLFKRLRTLLQGAKCYLICFQMFPNSLPKTTRGGVGLKPQISNPHLRYSDDHKNCLPEFRGSCASPFASSLLSANSVSPVSSALNPSSSFNLQLSTAALFIPSLQIGFPPSHPIKSPRRPHLERKRTRQDEATS
jgi:hypothetical protein